MSKDLVTTIIGVAMAAPVGAKEYLALQSGVETIMGWEFWAGLASATAVAVFGYWAKKGE